MGFRCLAQAADQNPLKEPGGISIGEFVDLCNKAKVKKSSQPSSHDHSANSGSCISVNVASQRFAQEESLALEPGWENRDVATLTTCVTNSDLVDTVFLYFDGETLVPE